jgi:hypothetical protein
MTTPEELKAALQAYIDESLHEGAPFGSVEEMVADFAIWVEHGGHRVTTPTGRDEGPATIWWSRA